MNAGAVARPCRFKEILMNKFMRMGRVPIAVILVLVLTAVLICVTRPAEAEPLDQYHSSWHLVRETADEDGETFAGVYDLTTEGNFANKDSSSVVDGGPFPIRSFSEGIGHEGYSPGSKWMFAICGKNYNNTDDTFSFNIVGWGKINGMLQNIAEGAGALGTQAVIVYPDDGDAVGELVSETSVAYDHTGGAQDTYFTVTNEGFDGTVAGMLAYVTGTNITSGYYQVTVVTDTNNIKIAVTATDDNTDSTVQINPAFWADTLTIDEKTKWPRDGDANNIFIYNSTDDEVAFIVVETTGLEWIQFVIYGADAATGEEAGDLTVYGRRY